MSYQGIIQELSRLSIYRKMLRLAGQQHDFTDVMRSVTGNMQDF